MTDANRPLDDACPEMLQKGHVDTEPDDDFALILGDVDASPLADDAPAAPEEASPEELHGAEELHDPEELSGPEDGSEFAEMSADVGETVETSEADADDDTAAVASGTPPLIAGHVGAEDAGALRLLLLTLLEEWDGEQDFPQLDLGSVESLSGPAVSVVLAFAKQLEQRRPGARLDIVNANDSLSAFFTRCNVSEHYPVRIA